MTCREEDINYQVDRFADIQILKYQVPGFENLSLKQKKLIYYLSQAALCGRDILFDQNYRHNLLVRYVIENIYLHYRGDRKTSEFQHFEVYLKQVWFCNGIHHHYSGDKIIPEFDRPFFTQLLNNTIWKNFPDGFDNLKQLEEFLLPVLFDPDFDGKRSIQTEGMDLIANSANNYYEGLTQDEVEKFYASLKKTEDNSPVSHGLNSKLVKENDFIFERGWKLDGMYSKAIEKIVYWLNEALPYTETLLQAEAIKKLMDYYKTGDLKLFDEYNILWLKDTDAAVDFINGFIETYGDPMGLKGSWEAIVNFTNFVSTKRAETLSQNAQWFEKNSPINARFKKENVMGVTARVINVVQLGGDCYPATPVGINLPNADWIRHDYGSKSVTIENIAHAYFQSALNNGFIEEFAWSEEEVVLFKKYGFLADNLHTDLHECVGHGSGKLLEGISTNVLKNYYSPLEEAKADLFALYFMMDDYLHKIGLITTHETAISHYNSYIRNGLITQLARIKPGKNIEQAHMRARQLIASWCYEKGKNDNVIEKMAENNKTFIRINDHKKLRKLFGKLLAKIQRIKSEGDFQAAKNLIERYALKVDKKLHTEILSRFNKLNLAPYTGFVNPVLKPVYSNGIISEIKLEYTTDYSQQMLDYSMKYSYLPFRN